jgi:hypothetical protein
VVYSIPFGDSEVVVDPADGGRIIAFKLGGKNVLAERTTSPEAYGSSFWPSPQGDWGWPPPLEIAALPYDAKLDGKALLLTSKKNPKLEIDVTEKVSVDTQKNAVILEYTIKNLGAAPRKVAPWQNSRVLPGGLTLYPSAGPLLSESTLKFDASGEVAWFLHDPLTMKSGVKSFGDGKEGWLAHVSAGLVFVKIFPDVPREKQAPKEAEVELFVDGAGRFVEVEQQGPYEEVPPGGSSTWKVTWILRKLPEGMKADVGSKDLLAFIRKSVSEVR